MNKEEFLESLKDHSDLKNHYLSDLSSNLENSANHFRKLSFYLVIIPLIYISVGFSDKTEINFLGVELNTSLLVALFPVIYSYITLRAYTLWLLIKDMKELKNAFFEKKIGSNSNDFLFLLNPYSLTSSTSYKVPSSYIILAFVLILLPFLMIISLSPAIFQAYIIYNLYIANLSPSLLYYSSLIISIVLSAQLLFTFIKAIIYVLAEFKSNIRA